MEPTPTPGEKVRLRPITDEDLDLLFEQESDPIAHHMVAFAEPERGNRDGFDAHWARIRQLDSVLVRAIERDGVLVGHIAKFERDGNAEVTYWIGRPFWGQGIATAALRQFLIEFPLRPIRAGAVADNAGSLRVLEKCGFQRTGNVIEFAQGRGVEVPVVLLILD
ncbi:MAG: GNAT family N-acetyltransferase [bacterium]